MRRYRLMLGALVMVLALSGCAAPANQQARQDKNKSMLIMTSFYPMYIMTLNITQGVEGVKVASLTPPQTGCLHDYQLRPSDVKNLADARILVVNGGGMESFMDKVVTQYPDLKVVEASEGADLIRDERTGEINPHLWVSITGACYEVQQIADGLAASDPRHAEQYQKNAQKYINQLEAQKQKMNDALAEVNNRQIVTFHEAFPYFAREFGLQIVSVVEREPGSEPSPGELRSTVEQVKKARVKALFAEPQYSPQAADIIAGETGAQVYILDPAVSGANRPDAYLRIMDKNLVVLKEALQ